MMSVRRSLVWTYGSQLGAFLLTFASTLIVARLVSLRDFGIFAMAGAVTTIINVFMQFGLAKYVMREAEISRDLLRSLFTVNVLMTLLYCSAILVGAGVAMQWFDSTEVGLFLLVFAIFPLFGMMEFVPAALAARDMRFGLISTASLLRALVLGGATISLAYLDFAYMSFAWAQVLASAATAVVFNVAVWRPDVWRFRSAGIGQIVRFGFQMIGISGISQLNNRASEITLGSLLGLGSLGLYSRASSLPTALHANIFGAGSNVVFSRLSHELREAGNFHGTYLRFMRLLLGLLWPMMLGIAVLAQPLMPLLYGAKWQPAATPLALLTIAAAITVAIGMTAEIFILRHQTARQLRIEIIRAVVGFAAFAAAATVSLTLAAFAKVAEALLAFALYRKPMNELVGGPLGELRRIYVEALMLTAVAILPALLLMLWFDWSPATPPGPIALSIFLGIALWGLLLFRTKHPLFLEATRFLRQRS